MDYDSFCAICMLLQWFGWMTRSGLIPLNAIHHIYATQLSLNLTGQGCYLILRMYAVRVTWVSFSPILVPPILYNYFVSYMMFLLRRTVDMLISGPMRLDKKRVEQTGGAHTTISHSIADSVQH